MSLPFDLAAGYAQRALGEAVLVGLLCGVAGVQVVLRRLSFFTMAMTHATFPGVVIAALLGVNLYLGSGVFGVLVVLAIAGLSRRGDPNSVTGVALSGGFALGVLLLSAQNGFTKDLTAYLVGSILTVQDSDLLITALTAAVVLVLLGLFGKELTFGAFDPAGITAAGFPGRRLELLVLLLVELAVVTSVPAVGTILAVALIVGPASTARLWTDSLRGITVLSGCFGILAAVLGLAASQTWNVAAGGAIVLVVAAMFAGSLLIGPRSAVGGRFLAGLPARLDRVRQLAPRSRSRNGLAR